MEPNQGNDKGNEQPKGEKGKGDSPHWTFPKLINGLITIGEAGTGVGVLVGAATAIGVFFIFLWKHWAWAYWTALILLPVVVLLFCNFFARKQRIGPVFRIWPWACALAAIVVSGAIGYWLPPRAEEELSSDFAITVYTVNEHTAQRAMRSDFWLLCAPPITINTLYPIHSSWYIHFVNLRSTPLMIDSYSVDTKQADGKWGKVQCIDSRLGQVFLVKNGDFSNALPAQFVESFDRRIESRTIPPGETVKGWILLEAPNGGLGTRLRFHIVDSAGNQFTQPFTWPDNQAIRANRNSRRAAIDFRNAQLHIGVPRTNLSN